MAVANDVRYFILTTLPVTIIVRTVDVNFRLRQRLAHMKKNMGTNDRVVRLIVVIIIAGLYLTGNLGGILGIILGIVAIAFLVTSLIGWCPIYFPFNISTKKGK